MKIVIRDTEAYLANPGSQPSSRTGVLLSRLPFLPDARKGDEFELAPVPASKGNRYMICEDARGAYIFATWEPNEAEPKRLAYICSTAVKQFGAPLGRWFGVEVERVERLALEQREKIEYRIFPDELRKLIRQSSELFVPGHYNLEITYIERQGGTYVIHAIGVPKGEKDE